MNIPKHDKNSPEYIILTLLDAMRLQIDREADLAHCPSDTARYIWNNAMNSARNYLKTPLRTIEEDFGNPNPETGKIDSKRLANLGLGNDEV